MIIPEHVQHILNQLTSAGFEAYAVGGCVRDSILGRVPHDWDICTSALPEETMQIFSGYHVIETGLKHGTVTVMLEKEPYEITTFRQDGDYGDHRRPDRVEFVKCLREDLARRDFTVNAMAADAQGTVIDLFGGKNDLESGVIRAVGNPAQRFQEDALRILRGLRFAAQLGFSIDPATAVSMGEKKALLKYVSGERVYTEMTKLLISPGAAHILQHHGSVLTEIFPEMGDTMGFPQNHPCHNRDVWGHTVEALGYSSPDVEVRWALLLHDLGKPACSTTDENGISHFYGHPQRGAEMARDIFRRLHADRSTTEAVCTLVAHHDSGAPVTRKSVRRWIHKFGPELLRKLLEVKRCDTLAHVRIPKSIARYENILAFTRLTEQVLEEESCFQISNLAVKGSDLLSLNLSPGPQIGQILSLLLEDVLEERCKNEKAALMKRAQSHLDSMLSVRKEMP